MILDIREKNELNSEGRVEGALSIPLSEIEHSLLAIDELAAKTPIQLLCRSGSRAQIAKNKLDKVSQNSSNITVIPNGLKGLENHNIIKGNSASGITIMRQVMIVAGLMVLAFSLAGLYLNPLFHWAAVLIGSALALAGLSGICPMAILLGKMPWNK